MAKITQIFGPYTHVMSRTQARWKFSGVRDDGSTAAWELTYFVSTRKFKVQALATSIERKYAEGMSSGMLPLHPTGAPHFKGTVTEILRKHIPKEQLAAAMARSIAGG